MATAWWASRILPIRSASCRRLDDAGLLAYLETDKRENVRRYERFGFGVTAEADVIGVKNWFMTREAVPPTSS